jgi:hypothetical protein
MPFSDKELAMQIAKSPEHPGAADEPPANPARKISHPVLAEHSCCGIIQPFL